MSKIKYFQYGVVLLVAVSTLAGCAISGLEKNAPSPNNIAQAPTATNATTTPGPINSSFNFPTPNSSDVSLQLPDFASIIASVRPSVVAINTKVPSMSIFGNYVTQEGAGSGWIIDSSGLIVTNNHVVAGAQSITVTLEDGRDFPADTVRTDPISDLAILKINVSNLPPALEVGDSSKLRVGDWVVAIGNSLGKGISATKGIVSAIGVSVSAGNNENLYDLIQTDAAINPGNSGGPLVNLAGEVIGINSIKVSQVGVEGMGYAISIRESAPIINDLIKNGYVTRPWMGLGLYSVDQTVVFRYKLAVNQGVLITQVGPGSPAEKSGLKSGDVITSINGKNVTTVSDISQIIHGYQVGQQITITYYRGNGKNTVPLTLAASPPPSPS